jgi:tetratricopeptide (TPR) repeat protein
LNTATKIGSVLLEAGKTSAAIKMYTLALEGYTRANGEQNVNTAETALALAVIYECKGKWSKAADMYDIAYVGYEAILGVNHAKTEATRCNLLRTSERADQNFMCSVS